MTGAYAASITPVRIVDNIKRAWYVAVDVIAGGSSRFVVLAVPNAEGAKILRIRAQLYTLLSSTDDKPQYFIYTQQQQVSWTSSNKSGILWSSLSSFI